MAKCLDAAVDCDATQIFADGESSAKHVSGTVTPAPSRNIDNADATQIIAETPVLYVNKKNVRKSDVSGNLDATQLVNDSQTPVLIVGDAKTPRRVTDDASMDATQLFGATPLLCVSDAKRPASRVTNGVANDETQLFDSTQAVDDDSRRLTVSDADATQLFSNCNETQVRRP